MLGLNPGLFRLWHWHSDFGIGSACLFSIPQHYTHTITDPNAHLHIIHFELYCSVIQCNAIQELGQVFTLLWQSIPSKNVSHLAGIDPGPQAMTAKRGVYSTKELAIKILIWLFQPHRYTAVPVYCTSSEAWLDIGLEAWHTYTVKKGSRVSSLQLGCH